MNYFATHRDAAEQREEILIKKKSLATSVSGARAHEKGKRGKNNKILCNAASYGKLPVSRLNAKVVTVYSPIASFRTYI